MAQDDFKMTFFLRESDFTTFFNWDKTLPNLYLWKAFWWLKVNSWFTPLHGIGILINPFENLSYRVEQSQALIDGMGQDMDYDHVNDTIDEQSGLSRIDDWARGVATDAGAAISQFAQDLLGNFVESVRAPFTNEELQPESLKDYERSHASEIGHAGTEIEVVNRDPVTHYSYTTTVTIGEYTNEQMNGRDTDGDGENDDLFGFTGWWSEAYDEQRTVYNYDSSGGINNAYGVTVHHDAGYDRAVLIMTSLYGDPWYVDEETGEKLPWMQARIAWGGYDSSTGVPKNEDCAYGIGFPCGNNADDPGTWTVKRITTVIDALLGI